MSIGNSKKNALTQGESKLLEMQNNDGSWEGEVVWCALLSAQYVLTQYILGITIPKQRKKNILKHFHNTQLETGLWGLHQQGNPILFVTTMVYIASRLSGVKEDDPLLSRARIFIENAGGVTTIPTWGKFWLAMLNLYDWKGVNPIIPEAWLLPEKFPLHPSNFYCHTRMIYIPMAIIYSYRFQVANSPELSEIRQEIFPLGFKNINWKQARNSLHIEDVFITPGRSVKALNKISVLLNKLMPSSIRAKVIKKLQNKIRWELKNTNHTSISPVSGLLNILALYLCDKNDPDIITACKKLEAWVWEDKKNGFRLAGARSASWDTAFAGQTLNLNPVKSQANRRAYEYASNFLMQNQIKKSPANYKANHRINPIGGWCFGGSWHGWPISDCTAEAMIALKDNKIFINNSADIKAGIEFIMSSQNKGGGFGSYEEKRSSLNLEWMNPSEMFADCMSEISFIECTASCIEALYLYKNCFTGDMLKKITHSIKQAQNWLVKVQRPEGEWPGFWGVNFIYGTFFAVRGLVKSGVSTNEATITNACNWLLSNQRSDGGWGEHIDSCKTGVYKENKTSQIIQTSWAILALLYAKNTNWLAIERAVKYLEGSQNQDGEWTEQEGAGVFFRTALLEYTYYRQYFPLMALSEYKNQRNDKDM